MALAVWNTELDIQNSLTSKPPLPLTGHTRLGRVQCHTATPPTRPVWDKLKSLRSLVHCPLSLVASTGSNYSYLSLVMRYSLVLIRLSVRYSLVYAKESQSRNHAMPASCRAYSAHRIGRRVRTAPVSKCLAHCPLSRSVQCANAIESRTCLL